jgi:hypothetical protein
MANIGNCAANPSGKGEILTRVDYAEDGITPTRLHLSIALDQPRVLSSSQCSMLIASSGGNKSLVLGNGESAEIGLNLYVPIPENELSPEALAIKAKKRAEMKARFGAKKPTFEA